MIKLRLHNKYLYLSCILLFLTIFVSNIIDNPDIVKTILFGWKPEPEYTSAAVYLEQVLSFDDFIFNGISWFQIILPVYAIIPVIYYIEEVYHYFSHSLYRKENYKKEVFLSLLGNVVIISVSLYLVYVIAIMIGYCIAPVTDGYTIFGELFGAWGYSFYKSYRLLYFIFEGLIFVFLPTFVYSFFALALTIYTSKKHFIMIIPILYHFILIIFLPIFLSIFPNMIFIYYLMPQVLNVPDGLMNPNIFMVFIGYIPYFIICITLVIKRLNSKEKVGFQYE